MSDFVDPQSFTEIKLHIESCDKYRKYYVKSQEKRHKRRKLKKMKKMLEREIVLPFQYHVYKVPPPSPIQFESPEDPIDSESYGFEHEWNPIVIKEDPDPGPSGQLTKRLGA